MTLAHGQTSAVGQSVCPHTGLSIPECSCTACLKALMEKKTSQ